MFLKSIEIAGFKTFAERTLVEFGGGVTSIIGPNGCGKSNIVDSIKWALGEQSAKSLRGGEMLDVIFNGNRRRKQAPYCEVCLVIDNTGKRLAIDQSEVAIRRKLSRSGESEYFLNEEPCRLRDIKELLLDTGLGQRSNTVIEQNQMNRLLDGNSKDRKILLEDAAGISRFRQRRHESMLKLNRVQENMSRLDDILKVYTQDRERLSRQAAKARRYENLTKDLRRTRIDVAIMELHSWVEGRLGFETKREEIQAEVMKLKGEEQSNLEEQKSMDQREIELEQELGQYQSQHENFVQSYKEAEHTVQNHGERLEKIREEVAFFQEEKTRFEQDLNESKSKLEQSRSKEELNKDLVVLDEELNKYKGELESLSGQLKREQTLLNQSQDREMRRIQVTSDLKNALIKIEAHIEHLQTNLKEIDERQESLRQKREAILSNEGLSEEQKKTLARFDELKALHEKGGAEIKALRDQQREFEQSLHKIMQEDSGLKSRLEVLKENESTFQGVGAGVKNIISVYQPLGNQSELYPKGIHGVVADLLNVPEKYQVAIEAALGGRMQNIVTSSADDAKRAIQFLRERKLGRATFLPLDRIRDRQPLPAGALSVRGALGEAFRLVGFDGTYSTLFGFLLKGVLVCETLDHASEAFKSHRVRMVTLLGDTISPEGAMTGGGKEGQVGLISRKSEINSLEDKIADLQQDINEQQHEHERLLESEDRAQRKLNDISEALKEAEAKVQDIQSGNLLNEKEEIRLRQEIQILDREREIKQGELEKAKSELEVKSGDLEKFNVEDGLEENSDITREQLGILEGQVVDLETKVRDREFERVKLAERLQSSTQEREYLEQRLSELTERIQRREELIHERGQERDRLDDEFQKASAKLHELEGEKRTKQKHYFDLKDEGDKIRRRRRDLSELMQQRVEQIRHLEGKLTDIAVKDQSLRTHQENLFRRIHEDFHLDIEEVYYSRKKSQDELFQQMDNFKNLVKEYKENILEIEQKLQNLGTINFEAVEQLKEVEDKESELKSQLGDLTDSHKTLDDFIKEMDETCRKMFKETFDQINAHFAEMFSKLFSGGEGKLLLDDDMDVLEAGVQLKARPPGKSPRVLSQLSGGEKAMTTLAFLFAIFLYKPSPFCVLDEIDAPLDENNVDRFMDAIRTLNDRCQFLIVTHNRRTMSLSDVVHGVTMQESGISSCLSVDIESIDFDEMYGSDPNNPVAAKKSE